MDKEITTFNFLIFFLRGNLFMLWVKGYGTCLEKRKNHREYCLVCMSEKFGTQKCQKGTTEVTTLWLTPPLWLHGNIAVNNGKLEVGGVLEKKLYFLITMQSIQHVSTVAFFSIFPVTVRCVTQSNEIIKNHFPLLVQYSCEVLCTVAQPLWSYEIIFIYVNIYAVTLQVFWAFVFLSAFVGFSWGFFRNL